jgi:UDP-perosamine 4-acetyltransferase
MKRVVGVGAGGHARVIVEILQLRGDMEIVGLTDPDPVLWNTQVAGIPILGNDEELAVLVERDVRSAFIGVGGVGDNSRRRRLYERVCELGFEPLTVVHPQAIVSPTAVVEKGGVIFAGAIINPNARVGENVIVNTGAIVEHDCKIAAHVHIAPGAVLCGGVRVSESAHIGAGATILQGVTIGVGAIVGAGAVVVADIPARVVVVGSPAKILRRISEDE